MIAGKCYLHSHKDEMYHLGVKLGLKGEALDNFIYAYYEVEITFEVDERTGSVITKTIYGVKVNT